MSENVTPCAKHEEHDHRLVCLEEKAKELEKDIDGLGGKINRIDKEFAVSKESMVQSLAMLSKLPDTLTETQKTMASIQITMVDLQHSLSENNKSVESLSQQVSGLKQDVKAQIGGIKSQVDTINEKSKFDILQYIKTNWPLITVLAAIGFAWIGDKIKVL